MIIEQNKSEILIRISKKIDIRDVQDILNYLRYKELTSGFKIRQSVTDKLASSIGTKWLKKNRKMVME